MLSVESLTMLSDESNAESNDVEILQHLRQCFQEVNYSFFFDKLEALYKPFYKANRKQTPR